MKRIHSVVKQYGGQASTIVTLSPLAQSKIAEFIEREINNPEVQVKSVNGKFILQGVVQSQEEEKRALIIAYAYVPDVVIDDAVADKKVLEQKSEPVINLLKIAAAPAQGPKKIIQLVVHFVELQKSYEKGFRFQWTPGIGDGSSVNFRIGTETAGTSATSLTGIISNLFPKLNWAKQHGHARVLKSSSLLVQEGVEGVINSYDKVPYVTATSDGQPSTSFESVGMKTAITASLAGARGESIDLKMNFGVSSLVGQTNAGPQTTQREVKTSLVIRSGQSAAVGGLITSNSNKNYNRLPANSTANPLISLYRSKDFSRSQSQFVVFVTPIIKLSLIHI